MTSAKIEFRTGGIGRRHQIGAEGWRWEAATNVDGWNGRRRPAGDQPGGDIGVRADADDEHTLSRLRDEQRSIDHHRADTIVARGESAADRVEVLAAMRRQQAGDVLHDYRTWSALLGAKPT
jgi:hypothetical protein